MPLNINSDFELCCIDFVNIRIHESSCISDRYKAHFLIFKVSLMSEEAEGEGRYIA
jgi:hypothetical protein